MMQRSKTNVGEDAEAFLRKDSGDTNVNTEIPDHFEDFEKNLFKTMKAKRTMINTSSGMQNHLKSSIISLMMSFQHGGPMASMLLHGRTIKAKVASNLEENNEENNG